MKINQVIGRKIEFRLSQPEVTWTQEGYRYNSTPDLKKWKWEGVIGRIVQVSNRLVGNLEYTEDSVVLLRYG